MRWPARLAWTDEVSAGLAAVPRPSGLWQGSTDDALNVLRSLQVHRTIIKSIQQDVSVPLGALHVQRIVNEAFRRATELGSSDAAVLGIVERSCRSDIDVVETKKVDSTVPSFADCLLNTVFVIQRIVEDAWAGSSSPIMRVECRGVQRGGVGWWRGIKRRLGLPTCVLCPASGGERRGCLQALPDGGDYLCVAWEGWLSRPFGCSVSGIISKLLTWVQLVQLCTAEVTKRALEGVSAPSGFCIPHSARLVESRAREGNPERPRRRAEELIAFVRHPLDRRLSAIVGEQNCR